MHLSSSRTRRTRSRRNGTEMRSKMECEPCCHCSLLTASFGQATASDPSLMKVIIAMGCSQGMFRHPAAESPGFNRLHVSCICSSWHIRATTLPPVSRSLLCKMLQRIGRRLNEPTLFKPHVSATCRVEMREPQSCS